MKLIVAALIVGGIVVLLVSCRSTISNIPPPVTEDLAELRRGNMASVQVLNHGRRIFASRCIECHVLPPISTYPAERWPRIVNWMAPRASLNPAEREAMLAYILAVRAQQSNDD
jgi:mono/diheme cytochrome c family protein